MRARYVVPPLLVIALGLGGCSSSGSTPSERQVTSPPTATLPTSTPPTATPTAPPVGVPLVTEAFTLLPCPADPVSTLELEGCAEHRIVRLDRQINADAKALYASMSDPKAREHFVDAQQAWIAYRQAACLSEADAYAGGSLEPVVFANCELRINRQRANDLARQNGEASP
jgi:uncharacterized protein YecT (DUF1311 family)